MSRPDSGVFGMILGVLSLVSSAARADEVTLVDGSRLVGRVAHLADQRLAIETDFAGRLLIDVVKVAGIEAKRRLVVQLKTGRTIEGELSFGPKSGQNLRGTADGDLHLSLTNVLEIRGAGDGQPSDDTEPSVERAEAAQMVEAKSDAIDQAAAQLSPLTSTPEDGPAVEAAKWTARLEIGLNGQTGEGEQVSFNGRAEVRRQTQRERLRFYGQGRYAQQDSARSVNEVLGGAHLEVDVNERWFTFSKVELEFDEFEELDLRATPSAGVGVFFIRQDDHELKGRAGIGYEHERFMDGTIEDDAVLELGYDYLRRLSPWLELDHSTTWYPSFDDPAMDYRVVSQTSGTFPLHKKHWWKLRVGMRNEYNPLPRPGVERLDTFYFFNVVYEMTQ